MICHYNKKKNILLSTSSFNLFSNTDIWSFATENIIRCLLDKLQVFPFEFSCFFNPFKIATQGLSELSFMALGLGTPGAYTNMFVYIYQSNTDTTHRIRHNVNFQAEHCWFNFRVFHCSYTGYHTKSKEICLTYNISKAGERRRGFMPFSRALARSKMQTALSRIWTRIADSINCTNNRHTTCSS